MSPSDSSDLSAAPLIGVLGVLEVREASIDTDLANLAIPAAVAGAGAAEAEAEAAAGWVDLDLDWGLELGPGDPPNNPPVRDLDIDIDIDIEFRIPAGLLFLEYALIFRSALLGDINVLRRVSDSLGDINVIVGVGIGIEDRGALSILILLVLLVLRENLTSTFFDCNGDGLSDLDPGGE